MKKGIVAFSLGLALSLLFSGVFLMSQHVSIPKEETLYYLQLGVYKDHQNATDMLLNVDGGYLYQKESHYYVICGVTSSKEDLENTMASLESKGLSYVKKEIRIEKQNDKKQQIEKLLEVLAS